MGRNLDISHLVHFSLLEFFSAMWKISLILITVMADDEPASDVKIIRPKAEL